MAPKGILNMLAATPSQETRGGWPELSAWTFQSRLALTYPTLFSCFARAHKREEQRQSYVHSQSQ